MTHLHFDLGHRSVLLDGKTVVDGRRRKPAFTVLLLVYSSPEARFTVRQLHRQVGATSSERTLSELLMEFEALGLMEHSSPEHWCASLKTPVAVSPSRERLCTWYAQLAATETSRSGRAEEGSFDARLQDCLERVKMSDHSAVLRALPPRVLTAMERRSSFAMRSRRGLVAQTALAESFLAVGDWKSAIHHAERALFHLRRAASKHWVDLPVDWELRIRGCLGAAYRIGATMVSRTDTTDSRSLINLSSRAYTQGLTLLADGTSLPDAIRLERRRWFNAASATPLVVSRDLSEASTRLATAQDLAASVQGDGADIAETLLLRSRHHLAAGLVRDARSTLESAEDYILRNPVPNWVKGWLPIYKADVARAHGEPAGFIRGLLRAAWEQAYQVGHQKLRVLARFAAWGIEPCPDRNVDDVAFRRDLLRVSHVWHEALSGVQASRCSTCSPSHRGERILPRICCTFGISGALGLWA